MLDRDVHHFNERRGPQAQRQDEYGEDCEHDELAAIEILEALIVRVDSMVGVGGLTLEEATAISSAIQQIIDTWRLSTLG